MGRTQDRFFRESSELEQPQDTESFLAFRVLLTPILIRLLHVFLMVACVLVGVWLAVFRGQWVMLPIGIFAAVAIRLSAESIVVVFSIHEALQDIRRSLAEQRHYTPPPAQSQHPEPPPVPRTEPPAMKPGEGMKVFGA